MKIACFYHSLLSDWNHGNAHFLRGIVRELSTRGHDVRVYEPHDGWSLSNLLRDHGERALASFHARYPGLSSTLYDLSTLSLDAELEDADLVIVHEWNDPELVRRIGEHRKQNARYLLLFHDTHHRMVSQPEEMERYDLSGYDGVLAFGEVLRRLYLARGVARAAFTWHEAADTRVFEPRTLPAQGDVVWVGNWGDEERTDELREFLLDPIASTGLSLTVHGVRYPEHAVRELERRGVQYRGWLANHLVPDVFARHAVTVHVPRRPYVKALVGVPTIRVFEALACGIPLLSAPWQDAEGLFTPGKDFLVAKDGQHMASLLRTLKHEPELGRALGAHGLATIRARHTCAHRVDELLEICRSLGVENQPSAASAPAGAQGESA